MMFLICFSLLAVEADIFLAKLKEELKKRGNPWIAGTTSVSHLPKEMKERIFQSGIVHRLPVGTGALKKYSSNVILPESLDWRNYNNENWLTRVRHQRECGSCWAFAWVGVQEAKTNIKTGIPDLELDLSEQFVLSCNPEGYGCDGGYYQPLGKWIKEVGLPDESCFPYGAVKYPCEDRCKDWQERGKVYQIEKWGSIPNNTSNLREVYQQELLNGPVMATIYVAEDFLFYKGGTYVPIMGKQYYHALVLCGYNNKREAWLFKNSYGTDFGEGGYVYLPYGTEGKRGGPSSVMWLETLPRKDIEIKNIRFTEKNDGVWDKGEEIEIIVTIRTLSKGYNNVTLELNTYDGYVEVLTNLWNVEDLGENSIQNNENTPFKVKAKENATPHEVKFNLTIKAENNYQRNLTFTLPLSPRAGDILYSFTAPGNGLVYGLAFDGNYVYAALLEENRIYKLDPITGEVKGTIPTPQNRRDCSGIDYDSTTHSLWVHTLDGHKIYKINPKDGTVLKRFNSPANQYSVGLAFDGEFLWVADSKLHTIWQIDTMGNIWNLFDIPISISTKQGARGLAFDPSLSKEGNLLLVITHVTADTILDSSCVYEITKNGEFTGRSFVVKGRPANSRAVEVVGNNYWVNDVHADKIYRVRAFRRMGVEEGMEKITTKIKILPNPTRGVVYFTCPSIGKIKIDIYDISGKLVAQIESKQNKIKWSLYNLPTGIYFAKIKTSQKQLTVKKIILIK